MERVSLPFHSAWEALRHYDFTSTEFLDVSSLMMKIEFRAKTIHAAESTIDVESGKSKRQKLSDTIVRSLIRGYFNPIIDTGRTYVRYAAKKSIEPPSFKSDLVERMAHFD